MNKIACPPVIENNILFDEYSTIYENILEFGFFLIHSPINKNEWDLMSKFAKIYVNETEEFQNKIARGHLRNIACHSEVNKDKLRHTLIYNENAYEILKQSFNKSKLGSADDEIKKSYLENGKNGYKLFLDQVDSVFERYVSCGVAVSNVFSKISEVYGDQGDPIIEPHQFMCSNNPSFFSSCLKINNYQSCTTNDQIKNYENKDQSFSDKLFMVPHIDPNTVVIVQADKHHRIQVFSEKHGWIDPLNYISDNSIAMSFVAVVLIGQATTSFTNELLPSSIHRVLCGSTETVTLNFCAMPSEDEALKLQKRKNMNVPPIPVASDHNSSKALSIVPHDIICPFKEFPLNFDDVISHWNLIDAIVGTSPSLPSYKEKEFWSLQIIRYHKYMHLFDTFLTNNSTKHPYIRFPDPPREVYYVWLVHMLQPLAYKKDCSSLFNRAIPHTNHNPDWSYLLKQDNELSETEKLIINELNCFNNNMNIKSINKHDTIIDIDKLFTHIDWWMGMDGVAAIYRDIYEFAPAIPLGNKKFIEKVCVYEL